MDTTTRIVLGAALLLSLHLGIRMIFGKAGRGRLTDHNGLTVARTILAVLIGTVLLWQLVLPQTIPDELTTYLSDRTKLIGLILFALGLVLRIWSQKTLGTQWSADLSVQSDHELIQKGPYALFVHPIYVSYILITPALFLTTANWLIGGLAFAYAVASIIRIPAEEKMLSQNFDWYETHKADVLGSQAGIIISLLFLVHLFGAVWELSL